MEIPQSELDKLKEADGEQFFDEDASEEETTPEPEVVEKSEEKVSESTDEDSVADKARIPYSRFETVNEAKIKAEARAELLEQQLEEARKGSKTVESSTDIDLPEEWVELYGDSDAAKRAYALQIGLNERLIETAETKVFERIQNQAKEEQEMVNKNLEIIEDSLAQFQEKLGRDLTEVEESAILDIQDEFTPKDENGSYVAPLLSPEKAFEVYELRTATAKAHKVQAKRGVVSLTGASSEGDVSASSANYNPSAWGSWRDKV